MKTKNLVVYGLALIIVVAIIVVANLLSNKRPSAETLKFFPRLSEKSISSFQVTDKDNSVRVFRKGDVWMVASLSKPQTDPSGESQETPTGEEPDLPVEGIDSGSKPSGEGKAYPADSASVTTALEKLANMKRDILVSENPGRQEVFEVTKEKGIAVEVWNDEDKKVGNFIVGKNAADWSSHYVRVMGSDKVHSVSGSIRNSFFSDPERWRDKRIVSFDKSLVKKLSLAKQGRSFEVEKSTDTAGAAVWNVVSPEQAKAKKEEVDKILDELSRLKCAEWAEEPLPHADTLGFEEPEITVAVTMENGEQNSVVVGRKKEGSSQFFVKTPGKDEVFLVADFTVKNFDKKLEDVKAPPEVATE